MIRVEALIQEMITEAKLSPVAKLAAEYSMFPGGKRIRPRLVLAVCQDLVGSVSQRTIECAVAVEFLHCASLVHDDLPAIDNDLFRRGQPTVHAKFGAGVATLVGDILPMLPLSLHHVPAILLGRAYATLSDGQVLDLNNAQTTQDLIEIHRKKTGSLFGLAMELGVYSAGQEALSEAARGFGELIGIEFQLQNDLIDATDMRGAAMPSDARNQRVKSEIHEELPKLLTGFGANRKMTGETLSDLAKNPMTQTNRLLAEIFTNYPFPK